MPSEKGIVFGNDCANVVAWKLKNTYLPVLVWGKVSGIVLQRFLHTVKHSLQVIFMALLVVYLQAYIMPHFFLYFVTGRKEGIKVEYLTIHFIVEITP